MKKLIYLFWFSLISVAVSAQTWTDEQILKANTAKNIKNISEVEKETILYVNLARLYPKLFISIELENYFGTTKYGNYLKNSKYRKSLITELKSMQAVGSLAFDNALYEFAKCFAIESGKTGNVGHKRTKCPKGNFSECCSYGMDTGKDIALQWLIDDKVPSLGHRINCLNREYTKIGVGFSTHKIYGNCAVADIIW